MLSQNRIQEIRNYARIINKSLRTIDEPDLDKIAEHLKEIGHKFTIGMMYFDEMQHIYNTKYGDNDCDISNAKLMMLKRKDKYEIIINKDGGSKAKRLWIAHALGHIVLGHLTKKDDGKLCYLDWGELLAITSEEEYYIKEVEATIFALELLIPR